MNTLFDLPATPTPEPTLHTMPSSQKLMVRARCPKCGAWALRGYDGNTPYYVCVHHDVVLDDGSDYPALYSAEFYALKGVKQVIRLKNSEE